MNVIFPIGLLLVGIYAWLDSNDNFLIAVVVMFFIWLAAFIFDHFRRFFPKGE